MTKFTKTDNKVSFFKITQSKYNELLNATADSGNGIIAGAIYFVEDGNVGRIYVNKKCYGEANLTNSVTNVTLENEGENAGKIKVTYSTGNPTYIPLPEGKVYTAGKGIEISDSDEISALDEELDEDLVVTGVTVGNYSNGNKIIKGTSLKDLLKGMLTKEIDCSVKSNPKVALKGVSSGTKVVGESVTGTLDYTYTDGQFNKPDGSIVNAGCVASNPVYVGSLPLTVALGQNKFKVTVDYSASTADLKTNLGNPSKVSIKAGSASSNEVVINGTYPFFATTTSATELTQQALKPWNASPGQMSTGNMKLVASTKAAPRKFSVPRKATSIQQLNTLSGKMETVSLAAYNETTEVKNYGGEVTYYTYTYSGDAEGVVTVDVKF